MPQPSKVVAVGGFVVLMLVNSYGQSLGDVARAQRVKQGKDAHAAHKVITNEDLPESTEPGSSTSVTTNEHENTPAPPATNDTRAGEEWKAKIEAQRNSVASLQDQLDKLNSSIHFASANCVRNCVEYNEQQLKKQEKAQAMQKQLEDQKQKLADMQESARQAGLGSSVYEP